MYAVESCKWVTNCPILSRQGVGLPALQLGPVWAYRGECGTLSWNPGFPPQFSEYCTSVNGTRPLNLFFSAVQCW